jgi:small conductance mechanosensitive channel
MLAFVPSLVPNPANQPMDWDDFLAQWGKDAQFWLRHDAPRIIGIIILALVVIRLLRMITHRLAAFSRRETLPSKIRAQQLRTLASVLYSVGFAVILFVTALEILSVLNINIGPLLASAGIAGLAIGFGAQTLVHDVINGFFILLENQFDVGDTVAIAGVSGTVEEMTLRRTVLRDTDGTMHSVPNSKIDVVSNKTRDWTQISLHVAVAYNENSDRVIGLLRDVANDIRNDPAFVNSLVADPEVPGIERVGQGEVDYLMLAKTKPGDQYRVSRELRRRIKQCFEKNKIQPASPARVYVVDSNGGRPA